MNLHFKFHRVLALALFGLTMSGRVWANGDDFFELDSADVDQSKIVNLFGLIRSSDGKVLNNVVIYVRVKKQDELLGMVIGGTNMPGHYHTTVPVEWVNAGKVEITATKEGYRQISPLTPMASARRRGSNKVQMNLVMMAEK